MKEQDIIKIMSGEDQSFVGKGMRCVMRSIEPIYSMAMTCRNKMFDHGIRQQHDLGRPTISIGNITTGGTGKTPFVTMLAEHLIKLGHRPAILMRGYHSDDSGSDEAMVYRNILGNKVVVEANPSRIKGAKTVLLNHPETSVFILDDGFQHRTASRQLDIVLIDATQPFGHKHVIPRGLLRESISSLKRADLIVLTRSDQVQNQEIKYINQTLTQITDQQSFIKTKHAWTHFLNNDDQIVPLNQVSTLNVLAITGIGNPNAFRSTLERHVKSIIHFKAMPDHHQYTNDDVSTILAQAKSNSSDALIMTEKDYVKFKPLIADHNNTMVKILRPNLAIQFLENKNIFYNHVGNIFQ
ncbi:Tetraacyldisaccharide 4'-kinase [Poriferisphaera corsica]|uniref:Tetraacyldisaccharide 4'-kinase n=1 Tax=Poriferisphaera corsica TaxID=2528020 RepID=A0A517YZG6_9BACT|nr:tetraacyldisaccharide 4'-kinase [Poriferisphaera corsica]QDU35589.1 Tetraacyldisaccharide 4'-kinase [Poriferisphaera corsica]